MHTVGPQDDVDCKSPLGSPSALGSSCVASAQLKGMRTLSAVFVAAVLCLTLEGLPLRGPE